MRTMISAAILLGSITTGVNAGEDECQWYGQSYAEGALVETTAGTTLACTCTSDGMCTLDPLPAQPSIREDGLVSFGVKG